MEYIEIKENLGEINRNIEKALVGQKRALTLLAVTKNVDVARINYAIKNGIKAIGENKTNELLEKYDMIDKKDLKIHFIGTLQTNKVKYIIDKVDMIESVNSLKLCEEINKRAHQAGRVMDILVEINIAEEASKTGIIKNEIFDLINNIKNLKNVKIRGLMTIPPQTSESAGNEKYFNEIYSIFIDIFNKKIDNINMDYLSMGMSDDYMEALKCGSNIIRLGRAIFGERKKY